MTKTNRLRLVTLLGVAAIGWSAPAGAASDSTDQAAGLRDPHDVALEAAGGEAIGGRISFLGVLGGDAQDDYLSIFKPFEEATGIDIEYEAQRDIGAILQSRVDGGNPPDIVESPGIGQILAFMADGKLVELSSFLDMDTVEEDWDQGWLDLGSLDGKLYGIFDQSSAKSLVWYDPARYTGPNPPASWDELDAWAVAQAEAGTTPWCIGVESGPATGWPATDWIESFLIKQSGPEAADRWWRGELPWTSPEVRVAFESFGAIATEPTMVFGGPEAVLATPFLNAGDPMYADPPNCYLHHQADFFGPAVMNNIPTLEPIDDVNFFPFPGIDPAYAATAESTGGILVAFNDTPQVRALLRYAVSPEAQAIMAGTGQWLAPNKRVPASAYPTALSAQAAAYLTEASAVVIDPSDLMPQAMADAFWHWVLEYIKDPSQLDDILVELDTVRQTAYD